jgi:hypothetical protein
VDADGSVNILNIGDSATIDPSVGYKSDTYMPWTEVAANLASQFKGALKGYKDQPPQPNLKNVNAAYEQNMIMTQTNLQTRE